MSGIVNETLAFWTPGPVEIIVILVVALLIFGKRLPEIARSVGKSFSEFKKGIHEAKEEADEVERDVRQMGEDGTKEAKEASGWDELEKKD
jgi:sec-independent protein translocase protein TatA